MRRTHRHAFAGARLPVFGESRIDIAIKLARRIVGNVEQFRLRARRRSRARCRHRENEREARKVRGQGLEPRSHGNIFRRTIETACARTGSRVAIAHDLATRRHCVKDGARASARGRNLVSRRYGRGAPEPTSFRRRPIARNVSFRTAEMTMRIFLRANAGRPGPDFRQARRRRMFSLAPTSVRENHPRAGGNLDVISSTNFAAGGVRPYAKRPPANYDGGRSAMSATQLRRGINRMARER